MNILAPISAPPEVSQVIAAGADELYCGVLPDSWKEAFGNVAAPNRRDSFLSNLQSYAALRDVAAEARRAHVPVHLCLNSFYTPGQYPFVLEQIEQALKHGVKALIVADPGLILKLKRERVDLDVHLSVLGTTFNSWTARFYEDLGVARIVLDRQLTIAEIEQIVAACSSVRFEVMIINAGCKNIDGFCGFTHGIWGVEKEQASKKDAGAKPAWRQDDLFLACKIRYDLACETAPESWDAARRAEMLSAIVASMEALSGVHNCGACQLKRLKEIGIHSAKIVGRNYTTPEKVQDVQCLKALKDFLDQNSGEDVNDYYLFARETFIRIYGRDCNQRCHFPEAMRVANAGGS